MVELFQADPQDVAASALAKKGRQSEIVFELKPIIESLDMELPLPEMVWSDVSQRLKAYQNALNAPTSKKKKANK